MKLLGRAQSTSESMRTSYQRHEPISAKEVKEDSLGQVKNPSALSGNSDNNRAALNNRLI